MIFYAFELLFLAINFLMAAWHRHLILENKSIVHWAWAALYVALVAPFWFLTRNPILIINLFLIREVFFSPILNMLRDKPYFYINPSSAKASLWDKTLDKWNPFFYFIAVISLIIFNIFL